MLDYMAIVLNKEALQDADFVMNVTLPDVNEKHMLRVKNGVLLVYKKKAVGAYLLEKPSGTVTGLKDAQTAMALQEAEQVSGEDFSGDWGERHEDELTDGQAQQTSGEDFSGDWGERHDGELGAEGQAQQTSGEPDAAQEQPVQYTDLPLDAEGYPVE